jgi:polysaccharide export outer membrane protein
VTKRNIGTLIKKSVRCFSSFLWVALCFSTPFFAQGIGEARGKTEPAIRGEMKIGPGDLLDISVFDTPELSGKVRVSENGDTFCPLIGNLHLAGMTPEQAEGLIRQKLVDGEFMKEPQVTVSIAEYASQGITVAGEVVKPGIYPSIGGKTLYDLVSLASGLTPTAGTTVAVTRRGSSEESFTIKFRNSDGVFSGGNVELFPGDTIVVQRAGIFYVLGDVGKPGGFVMEREHVTVLEAIALAQGTSKTASLNKVVLMRRTLQGVETSRLELKLILKNRVPNTLLRSGDIIYVPTSTFKDTLQNTQGVLQSVAGAAIYRY